MDLLIRFLMDNPIFLILVAIYAFGAIRTAAVKAKRQAGQRAKQAEQKAARELASGRTGMQKPVAKPANESPAEQFARARRADLEAESARAARAAREQRASGAKEREALEARLAQARSDPAHAGAARWKRCQCPHRMKWRFANVQSRRSRFETRSGRWGNCPIWNTLRSPPLAPICRRVACDERGFSSEIGSLGGRVDAKDAKRGSPAMTKKGKAMAHRNREPLFATTSPARAFVTMAIFLPPPGLREKPWHEMD